MKKLFTLTLGLMLTLAMFAADRRPTVTVTTARKYEIVIDGRHYISNGNAFNISSLHTGRHQVKVYELGRGLFMNSRRLVASSAFRLRNNDVRIHIDRFGNMKIIESKDRRDFDNRRDDRRYNGRNDRDWRY